MALFKNRRHAGALLGQRLSGLDSFKPGAPDRLSEVLVLGLPRGGVPVAFEVAAMIEAPLDVFIVRKLGVPEHEELAMGAIASDGTKILNNDVIRLFGVSDAEIAETIAREGQELSRREATYRPGRPPLSVRGKYVVLVDDGLATGSTMRAAVAALRRQRPIGIMVAVPVAPSSTCLELREEADQVVCLQAPESFYGVGNWYDDFTQTTDDEVRALLDKSRQAWTAANAWTGQPHSESLGT